MTSSADARNTKGKVLPSPNNLYAQWRLESGALPLLREQGDSPPELLLQAVWQHQRLQRDQLSSLDGETLQVLHPGFVSREGGPDFRGAVIQFGDAPPRSGDVEVDVHANGWSAHGHDRNPAFASVILHVIWDGDRPTLGTPPLASALHSAVAARRRPAQAGLGGPHGQSRVNTELRTGPATLVIRDKLDAPLGELGLWLNSDPKPPLPENLRGQCCSALRELAQEKRSQLLRDAAEIRFRSKASRLQARARQVGWEQSLWEGLFRGLGYKQNSWPMLRLAEQRPRWLAARSSPLELQARLLGIASLLPSDLTRSRTSADGYLRRVWDQWWREREEFADCILPASLWRFHGQRPANHPQRRLALVAHWLASGNLAANLERWCTAEVPERKLPDSLLEILQVMRDDFWSWHWTLRSARMKKPQPLLGPGRVTDLAVNVILPWIWVRAVEGKNQTLQHTVERRFQAWPPAGDNAVLRLARERLWGGAPRRAFRSAAEQQGCLQIGRDFCGHSDAVCRNCRFPRLVRGWVEFAQKEISGPKD